jgi:hypothetical protein
VFISQALPNDKSFGRSGYLWKNDAIPEPPLLLTMARLLNFAGIVLEFNFPPVLLDNATRADMTVSCRDCDLIPTVPDSGKLISFEGRPVQIMYNGLRVVAGGYCGDWMTGIIERLRGHHEPQEEVVFDEALKHLPPKAPCWTWAAVGLLCDEHNQSPFGPSRGAS